MPSSQSVQVQKVVHISHTFTLMCRTSWPSLLERKNPESECPRLDSLTPQSRRGAIHRGDMQAQTSTLYSLSSPDTSTTFDEHNLDHIYPPRNGNLARKTSVFGSVSHDRGLGTQSGDASNMPECNQHISRLRIFLELYRASRVSHCCRHAHSGRMTDSMAARKTVSKSAMASPDECK